MQICCLPGVTGNPLFHTLHFRLLCSPPPFTRRRVPQAFFWGCHQAGTRDPAVREMGFLVLCTCEHLGPWVGRQNPGLGACVETVCVGGVWGVHVGPGPERGDCLAPRGPGTHGLAQPRVSMRPRWTQTPRPPGRSDWFRSGHMAPLSPSEAPLELWLKAHGGN